MGQWFLKADVGAALGPRLPAEEERERRLQQQGEESTVALSAIAAMVEALRTP